MAKNKLGYISFAYGVGCILVVLGHSYPLGTVDTPRVMDIIRSVIYFFHMPLFFFISGFLLKYSNAVKKHGFKPFILGKAKKLLVPYLVLSILGYVPKLLVSGYISDSVEFSPAYFIRSLLVPRENIWGHFWFIPTLFFMYTLAASVILMASKCSNRVLVSVSGAGLLLAALFLYFYPIGTGWFSLSDICSYCIWFLLGYFACRLISRCSLRNALVAGGSAVIFAGFVVLRFIGAIPAPFMIFATLSMIYLAFAVGKAYERRNHTYLRFLENKTFAVFLLSWPFQAIVEVLFNKIWHLPWILVFISMFFVGLAAPLLIYQFGMRLPVNIRRHAWIIGIQEE